jgi:AcrR family transcriptional regulator
LPALYRIEAHYQPQPFRVVLEHIATLGLPGPDQQIPDVLLRTLAVPATDVVTCLGMPGPRRSTKEEIVLAAERLIAAHGLDGVSLRQIGAATGNGNNSAVIYHFGTKQRLIEAIFEYRLPSLQARRASLIDALRPSDLRGWLECQVRAVLEESELEDSRYMGFIASLQLHDGTEGFRYVPAALTASTLEFEAHLRSHLADLDEPFRSLRLALAMSFIVHAAAARERDRRRGEERVALELEVRNLVDATQAFLEAPVSASTEAARKAQLPKSMVP